MFQKHIPVFLLVLLLALLVAGSSFGWATYDWEVTSTQSTSSGVEVTLELDWDFTAWDSSACPLVSWMYLRLLVPDTAGLTVTVADTQYIERALYSGGTEIGWYPTNWLKADHPFKSRDHFGALVSIQPFRYSKRDSLIHFITSMTVELSWASGVGYDLPDSVVRDFHGAYQTIFDNYNELVSASPPVLIPGELLIIADTAYSEELEELVQWKNQKGIRTVLRYIQDVGNDTLSIWDTLQNHYQTRDLAWLLLVGGPDQITYKRCEWYTLEGELRYNAPSDPQYSKLEGGNYPAVFVGRFPAYTSAHASTLVERTLDYERSPLDTGWFNRAQINGNRPSYNDAVYEALLLQYSEVDTIYHSGTPSIASSIEDGVSMVIHAAAHSSAQGWDYPLFRIEEVNALTNVGKLPFIWSTGCQTGLWDGPAPCFGESWELATDSVTGEPTGSIGGYFASRNTGSAVGSNLLRFAADLIDGNITSMGALFFNSFGVVTHLGGDFNDSDFDIQTVFGDPSLQVWTDEPDTMVVYYPPGGSCVDDELDVHVVGAEGAVCALYRSDTLFGVALTDEFGDATIDHTGLIPDSNVILTVTALNKLANISYPWADADADGDVDMCDNCPLDPNSVQEDYDSDGVGDSCDNCLTTPNYFQSNSDSDELGDACDNCPDTANIDQADSDSDGIGDVCDPDVDGDGILEDGDSSGTAGDNPCTGGDTTDCDDNCLSEYNPLQEDTDSDGLGDSCDNCPSIANVGQADLDIDGIGDVCDPDIDGDSILEDGDYSGTAGDNPCTGGDTTNCDDNCVVYNPDQPDSNNDGIGDACSQCGDINADGSGPDIADLNYLVSFMFQEGPVPPVLNTTNVDGIGGPDPDIADMIYLVAFMFKSGPALNCP